MTRAYPFLAEVSLLTDKNQAIPVQVVRSGLRAVAYGGATAAAPAGTAGAPSAPDGREGRVMELRFLAANADVREGDVLVTSGIDGTYLPGLPVATVARIEREAGYAFAKIVCVPSAGIDRFTQVLVLTTEIKTPPQPVADGEETAVKSKRKKPRPERQGGAAQDASSTNANTR